MASRRQAVSEPKAQQRSRTAAYRVSNSTDAGEDFLSVGSSGLLEDRLNNWDFTDWRPGANNRETRKILKKGQLLNEEKLSTASGKSNENLQDKPGDSPDSDRGRRRHTPSTFPRTKMSASMPLSQRVALENLRTHLTFSDEEPLPSVSSARNNQRFVTRNRRDAPIDMPLERNEVGGRAKTDKINRSNNQIQVNRNANLLDEEDEEQPPDSTQVVGRLMQIRDYIKQATNMMERLQNSSDRGDLNRATQLEQVVSSLKEQENKYLELLLMLSATRSEQKSGKQEEETGRESDVNSESEAATELDVQSDDATSEGSNNQEASPRPTIEDRLGRNSVEDFLGVSKDLDNTLVATNGSANNEASSPSPSELVKRRRVLEVDLGKKNEELSALRQQHDLLQKMLAQQEELKALQNRQAALMALQRDAETRLDEERDKNNADAMNQQASTCTPTNTPVDDSDIIPPELTDLRERLGFLKNIYQNSLAAINAVKENGASVEETDDAEALEGAVGGMPLPSRDVNLLSKKGGKTLKPDYLKNLYDIKDSMTPQGASVGESEVTREVIEQRMLKDKLKDLQNKKGHMDKLLQELQVLRDDKYAGLLNNGGVDNFPEIDTQSTTSSQIRLQESINATAAANKTASDAKDVLEMMESNKKMKKLREVRARLDQLKGLVQYYQQEANASNAAGDAGDDQERETMRQEGLADVIESFREVEREMERLKQGDDDTVEVSQQEFTDSESASDTSLLDGEWVDDPEVQEKVSRLKAAKEKLKRLQELVSMVQGEGASGLPPDLAELAANLTEGITADTPEMSAPKAPRYALTDEESEAFYHRKMEQQRVELQELMDERRKLLSIQEELQQLHDAIPPDQVEESTPSEPPPRPENPPARNNQNKASSTAQTNAIRESVVQSSSAHTSTSHGSILPVPQTANVRFGDPLATVITNEELYGRMRQQRILREELRQKTKELEDMMHKDRPRKQYSRNQDPRDNQSDNVSFSNKSDPFGGCASVDQTMATWGGSTVDNMESIEEGGSGDGQTAGGDGEEECDDGYPSDGIVQVEEEEEAADEDSDDHDTYTIEEEPYTPKRRKRRANPDTEAAAQAGRRGNGDNRGAPQVRNAGRGSAGSGGYRYNYWAAPGNSQVLNNVRRPAAAEHAASQTSPAAGGQRQRSGRGGRDEHDGPGGLRDEISGLKEQLSSLSDLCSAMATGQLNPPHPWGGANNDRGFYSPSVSQSSLQQQQMLLSLNQCYSQLLHQQHDMQDRFSRLESLVLLQSSQDAEQPRPPHNPYSDRLLSQVSPYLQSQSSTQDYQRGLYASADPLSATGRNRFEFQPQFPDNFTRLSRPSPPEIVTEQTYNSLSLRQRQQRDQQQANTNASEMADQGAAYIREMVLNNRDTDNIPIDTIHASDSIPKLNLEDIARRPKKRQNSDVDNSLRNASANNDAVIGQRFPTPSRASAGAQLASQRVPGPRPGLSADISGTAYADTAVSVSSALSSLGGDQPAAGGATGGAWERTKPKLNNEGDEFGEFSLFEALRETIYSEVATLISQNETRPHYLIEIFRELQLLNSDYLRQRALYAIQDLVNKYLTDDTVREVSRQRQNNLFGQSAGYQRKSPGNGSGADKPSFDYMEPVDTTSSMSTPSSHFDNPFAQDSLGDTVIHLDKAFNRMRAYERKMAAESSGRDPHGASPTGLAGAGGAHSGAKPKDVVMAAGAMDDGASSSAQDLDSNGSVSDVPYPRIDPAALDVQIKSVMTEIIPVLKEHMEDVCSAPLLQYVRRLVLSLTRQPSEDNHEFVTFFHKQLGSILQDTLAKFEGRKMCECGEDLLVDLSEILFNELAFFRLMQDLDDPKAKVKAKLRQWRHPDQSSQTSTETDPTQDDLDNIDQDDDDGGDEEDEVDDDGAEEKDDLTELSSNEDERESSTEKQDLSEKQQLQIEGEDEELGKDRDDEMAAQVEIDTERDDDDTFVGSPSAGRTIMLAPSETKPMTRIGSDEDDEGDDESQSADEPSETAVSRDAEKEKSDDVKDTAESSDDNQTEDGATRRVNGVANGEVDAEEAEVTIDDLPEKLTVIPQSEINAKREGEASDNNLGSDQILESVEPSTNELAGDPAALKEPPSSNGI